MCFLELDWLLSTSALSMKAVTESKLKQEDRKISAGSFVVFCVWRYGSNGALALSDGSWRLILNHISVLLLPKELPRAKVALPPERNKHNTKGGQHSMHELSTPVSLVLGTFCFE